MIKFHSNSVCLVIGSSFSGKTTIVKTLVRNADKLLTKPPSQILVFHAVGNGAQFDELKSDARTRIVEGAPSDEEWEEIYDKNQQTLLVLDDLAGKVSIEKLNEIACIAAHHNNIFCIVTLHFIYHEKYRVLRINSSYIFLTKSPADQLSIHRYAGQLMPGNSKFIINVFKDATKTPFSYLLIDLHNTTPDKLRFRTDALLEKPETIVYHPL